MAFTATDVHLSKYKIVSVLGRGGSAIVYRGLSPKQHVAIKVFRKKSIPDHRMALDPNIKPGYLVPIPMEVYVLRRIAHQNIIRLCDFFYDDENYYVVTEVHGHDWKRKSLDLFECIESMGSLTEKLSKHIFAQILSALLYLNQMNVFHMDLKDENVVIDENYNVKLIDFGSACVFTNPATELKEFYGTLTYAPPEVLRGEMYRCDKAESWSLGVLLYTMLQGHLPFKNVQDAVYSRHIPLTKLVSSECADLLDQLLSNNSIFRLTLKETIKHQFLLK